MQEIDFSPLPTKAELDARLSELELRLTNTLTSRLIAVVGVGVAFLALLKFLP